MSTSRTNCIRLAAILAVVLVAMPQAGAVKTLDTLNGQAGGMRHDGTLQERGQLSLFQAVAANAWQTPELKFQAGSVHGFYFEMDIVSLADATDLYLSDPGRGMRPTPVGSSSDPMENVTLRTTGGVPNFDVRIIAVEPAPLLAHVHGATDIAGLAGAEVNSKGGITKRTEAGYDSPTGETQQGFVHRVVDEAVTFTRIQGGTVDVRVQGDFILEFYGLNVLLEDGSTNWPIPTGHTTRAANSTADTSVDHLKFLRLLVEDATLHFRHSDVNRVAQWTTFTTELEGDDGVIGFDDLRDREGSAQEDGDVRFPSGYTGTLTPQGDVLTLALVESRDPFEPSASLWLPPTGFNPLPVAAALLAVALVTLTVRSLRTPPPLAHMESALEAGSFSRAARLAGRILRKDPNRESAHLGRAIALSRSGRPERVVQALQPYLAGNEPTDGTLHYVLGLAYQDLGKERDAARALSEAVRRTPALAQQVGEAAEPERWTGPEGDAQGYT